MMPRSGVSRLDRAVCNLYEVKGLILHWLKGSRTPHTLRMSESCSIFSNSQSVSSLRRLLFERQINVYLKHNLGLAVAAGSNY